MIKFLFLTIPETEKFTQRVLTDLIFDEAPASQKVGSHSTVTSQDKSGKRTFTGLFYKGTNATHEAPSS